MYSSTLKSGAYIILEPVESYPHLILSTAACGRNHHWKQKELEVLLSLQANCRIQHPPSLLKNRRGFVWVLFLFFFHKVYWWLINQLVSEVSILWLLGQKLIVVLLYINIVTVTCTLKHWISCSSIECFLRFYWKKPTLNMCVHGWDEAGM